MLGKNPKCIVHIDSRCTKLFRNCIQQSRHVYLVIWESSISPTLSVEIYKCTLQKTIMNICYTVSSKQCKFNIKQIEVVRQLTYPTSCLRSINYLTINLSSWNGGNRNFIIYYLCPQSRNNKSKKFGHLTIFTQ